MRYRRTSLRYCVEHGLRFHRGTFVYFNGPDKEDKRRARLRNFVVEQDFVASHVLDSKAKAETWRLGHEMSEDAVSWNVFAALLKAGKLSKTARHLTDRPIEGQPELYLWGCRVEFGAQDSPAYAPLCQVRTDLEWNINKFKTEPDIMLVFPNQLIIRVEAKFESGNTLATDDAVDLGDKPKDIRGLVDRYLEREGNWPGESRSLVRKQIAAPLHSQLFRNVVFAARMAEIAETEWHVVNLTSSTQWKNRPSAGRSDFKNPTKDVQSYLSAACQDHFTFRTWEGIYAEVVQGAPHLTQLEEYFVGKSAHFRPAFAIG